MLENVCLELPATCFHSSLSQQKSNKRISTSVLMQRLKNATYFLVSTFGEYGLAYMHLELTVYCYTPFAALDNLFGNRFFFQYLPVLLTMNSYMFCIARDCALRSLRKASKKPNLLFLYFNKFCQSIDNHSIQHTTSKRNFD